MWRSGWRSVRVMVEVRVDEGQGGGLRVMVEVRLEVCEGHGGGQAG